MRGVGANCGNGESREVQAWCTRHLAAGVIHSFPTPPAIGPPMLLTDTRALSNSSLAAVYLWLAIAKAVSRLNDWSCFMQPRCVVHTLWHHIMAASSIFSRLSVAGSGETWYASINCWYRISQRTLPAPNPWCLCITSPVFPTIYSEAVCGLSDRRGWPDGAADYCLPSIGHDY